jgi:uncharacterized protein YgiM (DUF1202 family)
MYTDIFEVKGAYMKMLFSFRLAFLLVSIAGVLSQASANVFFCIADNVNVRSAPDTTAEILGTFAKGDSIVVVDERDEWFKFYYQNEEAWASKRFFSERKAQDTETGKYWYNSKTGVLHNSKCRWFGKTESGYFTNDTLGTDCGICKGANRVKIMALVESPATLGGQTYWINSKTMVRHNSSCRWYGNTKNGYYTKEKVGKPCGICGG